MPVLLLLPQSPAPDHLLLLLPAFGVLPVGADRMLSMYELTSGGAGELTVRGLPIEPPTPAFAAAGILSGDSPAGEPTTSSFDSEPLT